MKKNIGILFILFAVISIFNTGIFAQRSLTQYWWNLTRLNGKDMSDSNAFLNFDGSKNGISGNAGCNKMFGSYTVKGSSIKFSKIGTTKMLCAKPGVMKDEADFTRTLSAATRYSISRNTLRIYSGRKQVLEFAMDYPTLSLTSTVLAEKKWYLDEQPARKSTAGPEGVFIIFDSSKGSAGGNTGCNAFGGSYTVKDSAISITEVISTMRACVEDDRMTTERKFLDGLRKADRYDIEDNTLTLFEGSIVLLTFTGYDK